MLSVTVLVKNAEATLADTLRSLESFSEVILLDTGSTDQTLAIAGEFPNVKIFHAPFQGFGPSHNLATSLAAYDFVLSLDSDEILSDELIKEIHNLSLDKDAVYRIRRDNYFQGKWIRGCSGWYPDRVLRLYNRKSTSFTNAAVHEKIVVGSLKIIDLTYPMKHTPYRSISEFLAKMQMYTTLFAEQNVGKKSSSLTKALLHAFFTFVKSYFFKRGIFCGFEGFFISLYNAHTAFYKYIKLLEANQKSGFFH
jgi:glycosyltransferase involved in cell wall biosynthesis